MERQLLKPDLEHVLLVSVPPLTVELTWLTNYFFLTVVLMAYGCSILRLTKHQRNKLIQCMF